MRSSGPKEDEVARNIAGLAALDRTGISAAWGQAFGAPPPRKLSRVLMEKALAHQMQCKAFGGLDAATRRVLRQAHGGGAAKPPARSLSPGSRLMREWNGRTHEVEVLEDGFRWQGRTWRSLSRIAREITGSNWSGPRFFGLTAGR